MSLLKNHHFLFLGALIFFAGCNTDSGNKNKLLEQTERPNIVLVMADDLGFSDLGCYGGEINTPNLDEMSANGLRYAQFYNASRCCPTRASLLTGLPPHLAGVGHMTEDRGFIGYRGELATNSVTIAEALKLAGYQTAMTGKWHVTKNISPADSNNNWPTQRGFDKFYGTLPGHGSYFDPKGLFDGNTAIKAEDDYYYTEAISNNAIKFIKDFNKNDAPFFMYVAYTAPHYPIHARDEFKQKYKGKFSAGWDSLRIARYNRLMKTGIFPAGTLLPGKDEQCYNWETETNKQWQEQRMEVYAAMIEQMDKGIGDIIQTLRESGKLDNTILIFLSDNGASSEGHLNNTIERSGATWKDKMIPAINRNGQKVSSGDLPGFALGADTTYGSYGTQWAHLSGTPFKRYKSWLHEGGIATPMIIQWPKQIADKGKIRFTIADVRDFMPTFLDIAGVAYPKEIRNVKTIPLEGISLVKSFMKDDIMSERILCWEHEGNRAIRKGKWKLVSEFPGAWKSLRHYPQQGKWELYDMEKDRTETNNLASAYPELVNELSDLWKRWALRSNVLDWKTMGGEKWY